MNVLKKQFIKSMIKLTVIENTPGLLKIHIAKVSELDKVYKMYDKYILEAVNLLTGVEAVSIDYEKSILVIQYEDKTVKPLRVYHWIQTILDTTIDHLDFIKKYGESHTDYVTAKLKPVLQEQLKNFNK